MSAENELHLFPDPSGDLIAQYCSEARGLITRAGNREEALKLRHDLCSRFALTCKSSLVLQATTAYIDDLIAKTWRSP